MKKTKSRCPACGHFYGRELKISTHHIFPRRYYDGSGPKIKLCLPCHQELEKLIPHFTKKSKHWYKNILKEFLEGEFL